MYVDLEKLAGTRTICTSFFLLFSSYKSAFDRYRYALSRIPKHPTTKETIDEIPETNIPPPKRQTIDEIPKTTFTLASIATSAASSRYDIDSITTDTIDFNEISSTFAIENKALIIYRQSNENNTLCQKYINSSKVCIQQNCTVTSDYKILNLDNELERFSTYEWIQAVIMIGFGKYWFLMKIGNCMY